MIAYKLTNAVNNKGYIGITQKTLRHRWSLHKYAAQCGKRQFIAQAIRKYGPQNFKVEELASAASFKELMVLERALIAEHGTYFTAHGYNMTIGGEGVSGIPITQEHLAKLSKAAKGRKHSAETNAKRTASIAASRALYGDELRLTKLRAAVKTPEYREKKRAETAARMGDPIERQKLSATMALYRARPEVRAMHSAIMKARNALGNNQTIKTHCPKGHAYDAENTYYKPNGWRSCRTCRRTNDLRLYHARRASDLLRSPNP